jgi:hypothetical protein
MHAEFLHLTQRGSLNGVKGIIPLPAEHPVKMAGQFARMGTALLVGANLLPATGIRGGAYSTKEREIVDL